MQTHCHGAEGLSHCCWTSDLITHPAHRSSSPSPHPRVVTHTYTASTGFSGQEGPWKVIKAIPLSLGLPLPSDHRDRRSFSDVPMP